MGLLARLSIVVQDHVPGVTLCFPRRGNWLHQALLGYVHEFAVNRGVRIHSEELGVIFDFLVLRMVLRLLLTLLRTINDVCITILELHHFASGCILSIILLLISILLTNIIFFPVKSFAILFNKAIGPFNDFDLISTKTTINHAIVTFFVVIIVVICLDLHDFPSEVIIVGNIFAHTSHSTQVHNLVEVLLFVHTILTTTHIIFVCR